MNILFLMVESPQWISAAQPSCRGGWHWYSPWGWTVHPFKGTVEILTWQSSIDHSCAWVESPFVQRIFLLWWWQPYSWQWKKNSPNIGLLHPFYIFPSTKFNKLHLIQKLDWWWKRGHFELPLWLVVSKNDLGEILHSEILLMLIGLAQSSYSANQGWSRKSLKYWSIRPR